MYTDLQTKLKPTSSNVQVLHSSPRPCIPSPSPTYYHHMSPKNMSNSASNSNDHKRSDFLPGLEDLGKLLKACSPNQGKKSDRSRIPDGKDCQICNIKDTCKTVVQASNELIEQGSSISEKETQHNKDQGMINPTRKPTQRQPKYIYTHQDGGQRRTCSRQPNKPMRVHLRRLQ